MSDRRALGRDVSGATAMEFALVLPIFVAIMIGLFEFGWTQHCLSSIRYALSGAARALMLNPALDEAALQARVRADLTALADADVTVRLQTTAAAGGRIATLTATYQRSIGVPMLATFPLTYTTEVETVLPAL